MLISPIRTRVLRGTTRCRMHAPARDLLTEWDTVWKRAPEALAVDDSDRSLTYESLACESDRWAHRLSEDSSATPVMVRAANSAFLAATILGTLKAGRVCVPLASSTPPERVRQLATLCAAGALISEDPGLLAEARAWDSALRVWGTGGTDGVRPGPLARSCNPMKPAFLLFTSGTNGRPKPVLLRHGNIVRECRHFQCSLGLRAGDRSSWLHGIGALAGLRELVMSLLSGGTVCPFSYADRGAAEMARWLQREEVTACRFVPSMFRQFCALLDEGQRFASVRVFYMGGEHVVGSDFALFRRHFPQAPAFSIIYGSTETGLCLENSIPATAALHCSAALSLGRPVPGYHLHIIAAPDSQHSGELVVSGSCLNEPVPEGGALLRHLDSRPLPLLEHHTGDKMARQPDGCWQFVSRLGDFVKIAGNRVGLSEVRDVMLSIDSVRDCQLIVNDEGMTAFVEFAGDRPALKPSAIRAALLARVPAHMVPTEIREVPRMPLTPGGKANLAALRKEVLASRGRHRSHGGPWSPTERLVGDIWAVTLKRHGFGRHESFFALGGTSLLAVIAAARLSESLGRPVAPALFASCPSVAEMAAALERLDTHSGWSAVVPLRREGTRPPLILFHPVGGGVMSYLPLVEKLTPERPVFGLQAHGLDGISNPSTSVAEAAARFLPDILRLQRTGPYFLAGHSFGGRLAYETACQLRKAGHAVAFVGLFDSHPNTSVRHLPTAEAIRFMGARARFHWESLAELSWSQRLSGMRRLSRKLRLNTAGCKAGGSACQARSGLQSLAERIAAVRTCLLRASQQYLPGRFDGSVVLFKARRMGLELNAAPDYGWGELAEGGATVVTVEGSHATMVSDPHVEDLARRLDALLGAAS